MVAGHRQRKIGSFCLSLGYEHDKVGRDILEMGGVAGGY